MFTPFNVNFFLIYNSAQNPFDNSYIAYVLVILSNLQIFALNGFFGVSDSLQNQDSIQSDDSSWLNQWLHFLGFTRFSSWETLNNMSCLFQITSILLFLITGCLGLLIIILRNRLTESYRFHISTFKGLLSLCDLLLYLPALDFLTHSYIPNADLAHQISFGTFQNDNDSISSSTGTTTMTETTAFGWFRIFYLLAFLAYFFTRKLVMPVDLPFGTILQSKLCYNDSLFEHFRILFILILSIVDWRVREHGLSPLVIDVISCCFGISQVVLGLKWMTYHYYKTHLLYGLISSFYLSHSIILLVRHQFEAYLLSSMLDTVRVINILDVAYFSTGIFCMWIFYNIYKYIYSLHLPSDSSALPSLSVIAEKYNIHRLLEMKNEKTLNSEIAHYLQCHFAACSDPKSCPCSKLLLKSSNESSCYKELNINYYELHDSKKVEEFMVARLTYMLTTPNWFYGKLSFLVRVISYLAFRLDRPVQACMTVAKFSEMKQNKKQKFKAFYEYFFTEIKRIATNSMTEEEKKLYNYNISNALVFDELFQKAKADEGKIRVEYTNFFSYLYESAFVDLQKLHNLGRKLVEQIEGLENTFNKLTLLNPENTELVMMIMKFQKLVREESGHSIAVLNTRLSNIFQKRSMRLYYKNTGQKALFSPEDNLDEKTMFMMVDLFQHHGQILKASQNFYKTFGINKELESNVTLNSIFLPDMREAHQHALLQMTQKTETFLTTHKFENLIFGLNRDNLLVPLHLYSKIEVQGSQVYAAASLQTEDSKSIIILDEGGYIISFTKTLEHLFEGLQYQKEGNRMNMCLLIPALIPIIHGKLKTDNNSLSSIMLVTHKLFQRKTYLTTSKVYSQVIQQFNERRDPKMLTSSLMNLLNMMLNEHLSAHRISLIYNYRQALNMGHWELEITDLTQLKEVQIVQDIIPKLQKDTHFGVISNTFMPGEPDAGSPLKYTISPPMLKQNGTNITLDLDKSDMMTIPVEYMDKGSENFKFETKAFGELLSSKRAQPLSIRINTFNNSEHVREVDRPGRPSEAKEKLSAHTSGFDHKDWMKSDDAIEGSVNFGLDDQKHLNNGVIYTERVEKPIFQGENRSVGRNSSSTRSVSSENSSRMIRQFIQEPNSMRLIRSHYLFGIGATIVILTMIIIQYAITSTAIIDLEGLAAMNIHPSETATYLQRARKQGYTRGMIDKYLISPDFGPSNLYYLMFYFNGSITELPLLLQDVSSSRVLSTHISKYPVSIVFPETLEVQNVSLISAIQLAINNGYLRAVDADKGVNTSSINYQPRRFAEYNIATIVDNLLTYVTEIQVEFDRYDNSTGSVSLLAFCIGCSCAFLTLICLALVVSTISKKEHKILIVFCKISKKDLQLEAARLADNSDASKKKSRDENRFKDKMGREKLFTDYQSPKSYFWVKFFSFILFYGIMIIPFLISYTEINTYSKNFSEGIQEYNTWEVTRTEFVEMYADAEYVFFNTDSDEENFQKSLTNFMAQLQKIRALLKTFDTIYTELGVATSHPICSQPTMDKISGTLKNNFCDYLEEDNTTESACTDALGGIAKNGMLNTMNYITDFLEKKVLALNSTSNRIQTMMEFGYSSQYEENEGILVAISRMLRLLSDDMNTDLMKYLNAEKRMLLTILVISIVGYFIGMMIGWTLLVRRLSHQLNQTKRTLNILPIRLIRGNSFIKNILVKEMKLNIVI